MMSFIFMFAKVKLAVVPQLIKAMFSTKPVEKCSKHSKKLISRESGCHLEG